MDSEKRKTNLSSQRLRTDGWLPQSWGGATQRGIFRKQRGLVYLAVARDAEQMCLNGVQTDCPELQAILASGRRGNFAAPWNHLEALQSEASHTRDDQRTLDLTTGRGELFPLLSSSCNDVRSPSRYLTSFLTQDVSDASTIRPVFEPLTSAGIPGT